MIAAIRNGARRRPLARLLRRIGLATWVLTSPLAASAEYTLRPGDLIAMSTVGPFDITHESVVDSDGLVTMPVIGQVPVAGMTLSEARTQIAQAISAEPLRIVGNDGLERWLNLQPSEVVVEIASYAPVFVSGSVAQPGRFAYTPGMTVRQLVAEAGGLGVGLMPDDPNSRQSIELAADREVAAQRVDAIMTQVNRLREELRSVSEGTAQTSVAEPEDAQTTESLPQPEAEQLPEGAAEPELPEEPEFGPLSEEEVASVLDGAETVTRPLARPTAATETSPPAEEEPATVAEAPVEEPSLPPVQDVPEVEPLPVRSTNGDLRDVGRQLVEAGVAMRGVDAAASRQLIEEMNTRLELLRRRQIDEEALVERDRAEVARVQDLIERGLVPATEGDVAERALLMSSMQSYDTADAIARMEIELARMTSDLERQPSEAARAVLLDLESQLAQADVAVAQLDSIEQRLALLGGPAATQTALDFEFVLHRGTGEAAVASEVDQDEPLLPGDVLEVILLLPDPPQSSAALE